MAPLVPLAFAWNRSVDPPLPPFRSESRRTPIVAFSRGIDRREADFLFAPVVEQMRVSIGGSVLVDPHGHSTRGQTTGRGSHRGEHHQLIETPRSRPIAAVAAIAKPPPIVTRNAARPSGAPPR